MTHQDVRKTATQVGKKKKSDINNLKAYNLYFVCCQKMDDQPKSKWDDVRFSDGLDPKGPYESKDRLTQTDSCPFIPTYLQVHPSPGKKNKTEKGCFLFQTYT